MTTLYKLTNQDGTIEDGYLYGLIGKTHGKPDVSKPELGGSDVIRAFNSPSLAILLTDIKDPRLFEVDGDVEISDSITIGSFFQTVVKELPVPKWVNSDKINAVRAMFSILCADQSVQFYKAYDPTGGAPEKAVRSAMECVKNPSPSALSDAYVAARESLYVGTRVCKEPYARFAAFSTAYAARSAAYATDRKRLWGRIVETTNLCVRAASESALQSNFGALNFASIADKAVKLITENKEN